MEKSRNMDMRFFLNSTIKAINLALELPVSVWLLNEEKDEFRIVCGAGLPESYIIDAIVGKDEATSLIKKVFDTKQTIVVPDIQSSPFWKRKAEAEQINLKAAVASKLLIKKRVIGGLVVYIPKNKNIEPKSIVEKVEVFAVDIANRLRYVIGMDILNRSAQKINEEILSPELFKQILRSAVEVLDCEHINLFLRERDGDHLILKESSTPDIQEFKRSRFKLGEGLVGHVAQSGEMLFVSDVVKDERFVKGQGPFTNAKERSMLLAPIRLKDAKIIGVICADALGLGVFDTQDIMLWEAFTRQTEVAIQNQGLYERLQNQRDSQLEAIGNISGILSGPHKLEQALKNIMKRTLALMDEAAIVEIRLLDKQTNELVAECYQGETINEKYKKVPVGEGITGWVAEHRESRLVDDVQTSSFDAKNRLIFWTIINMSSSWKNQYVVFKKIFNHDILYLNARSIGGDCPIIRKYVIIY